MADPSIDVTNACNPDSAISCDTNNFDSISGGLIAQAVNASGNASSPVETRVDELWNEIVSQIEWPVSSEINLNKEMYFKFMDKEQKEDKTWLPIGILCPEVYLNEMKKEDKTLRVFTEGLDEIMTAGSEIESALVVTGVVGRYTKGNVKRYGNDWRFFIYTDNGYLELWGLQPRRESPLRWNSVMVVSSLATPSLPSKDEDVYSVSNSLLTIADCQNLRGGKWVGTYPSNLSPAAKSRLYAFPQRR